MLVVVAMGRPFKSLGCCKVTIVAVISPPNIRGARKDKIDNKMADFSVEKEKPP